MARSFYRPSAENVIEDYTRENHFFHAPSNRHYRMVQREGRFFQRRYRLDSDGNEKNVLEREVTWIIGSGEHARSYLSLDEGGVLRQLPVTWYPQIQRWGMSPGYDRPDHEDFARQVTHSCLFCHNGYPLLPSLPIATVKETSSGRNCPPASVATVATARGRSRKAGVDGRGCCRTDPTIHRQSGQAERRTATGCLLAVSPGSGGGGAAVQAVGPTGLFL